MKTRLEAIAAHWSNLAQYFGGSNAKRYRSNLKRASTAARETADLFARFEGEARPIVADDIETLRKAASLLQTLSEEFEVAQRKADKIQDEARKKREAEEAAKVKAIIAELFGVKPDPQAVFDLAADLECFDRTGADEYAKGKGCTRGLFANAHRVYELKYCIQRKDLADALQIIAVNRLDSHTRGYLHIDRDQVRWWHANWDDFVELRKLHQQGRAA